MTAGTEIVTILCGIGGILWVGLVTFIALNNKVYNAIKRWMFILGMVSVVTACISLFVTGFYQNDGLVQIVFFWLLCLPSVLTFTILMIFIGKKNYDLSTEFWRKLQERETQKFLDQHKKE